MSSTTNTLPEAPSSLPEDGVTQPSTTLADNDGPVLPQEDTFQAPSQQVTGNEPTSESSEFMGFQPENMLPIEEIAEACNMVPFVMARPSATIPAEQMLRQFGQLPETPMPWLPVATMGPLLIMGHFDPNSQDFWGMPRDLVLPVVLTPDQYAEFGRDFQGRLELQPMDENQTAIQLPECPKGDVKAVFAWFVKNYPFISKEDAQRMKKLYEDNEDKDLNTPEDLNFLPRHYGYAINYMAHGTRTFTAEISPNQEVFPNELLEKHTVYPILIAKKTVYLLSPKLSVYGFEDEWHSAGREHYTFKAILADPAAIREAIQRDRGRTGQQTAQAMVGELSHSDQTENLVEIDPTDITRVNPNNPNTTPEQVVQWVLWRSLTMRASDLHVEKFYNTARFRARIDGELVSVYSCSEEFLPRYVAIFKNYCGMGQQRQDTQDARFSIRIGHKRIDVRVAAIPCRREQQKLVMRFLDKQDGIRKLSELNMSTRQSDIIKEVCGRDQGLVLVTGPTGSGKTTTLYAFINSINHENINIQTIEDPIEYEIEGINQTQTNPFHGITFATGLRSLLRCDPDVILVGESRDAETAQASINAALTGHLVFTTLHANDSLRAVSRLLSMGVEGYLLADALVLSQAQRLARRLCSFCKAPQPWTQKLVDYMGLCGALKDGKKPDLPIYMKTGCPECNNTGYKGRVALMEMCPVGAELQELISENAPISKMRAVAMKDGFLSLYQEGLVHVLAGNTSLDEIACLTYTAPEEAKRFKW